MEVKPGKLFRNWTLGAILFAMAGILTAQAAPQIIGFGPPIRYVGVHGTYSFHVVAAGRGLRYHWWNQEIDADDGHAIPPELGFGVLTPRLRVTDAQDTRDYNGFYWCEVTDVTGQSVFTPQAQCVVVAPPTFTQQPASQTVAVNSPASLTVAVNPHGPVPVRYQWFFNSRPIIGATRPTLSFVRTNVRRQGTYNCRVKTIGGTNYSSTAFLTVTQ
jgi:hypothetical protein